MKNAVKELEKCGVRCYNLESKIEKLDWFVGGTAAATGPGALAVGAYGVVVGAAAGEFAEMGVETAVEYLINKLYYVMGL